ncbi:TetR/AcrR family transcriptional regulator [Rhodobacter sp. Har01]|uniref:TetR/AcrR family transcriptional regulator n=1 Tax=Rhodobacter sp. Har01 TaxID=2883999 RepID=UPI002221354E|nr:TetR/AcrR family transcriptional regulator [Rhodobacter sp. Har01]
MRALLLATGRQLFTAKGYAATGTPEIVAAAGVTRGALYHHFADKAALFEAVIRAEAQAVAQAIEAAEDQGADPVEALVAGGRAFLAAMAWPGRARLLLVEAPAVLGPVRLAAIDAEAGGRTLVQGLRAAGLNGPVDETAQLLSAAHDRAALAIAAGADPGPWAKALERLVRRCVAQ